MLVGLSDFDDCLAHLIRQPCLALDTETTGLRPYHGDRLFSKIFYDGITPYYFNFQDYPDEGVKGLPRTYLQKFDPLYKAAPILWYLHNAKFDQHMLAQEQLFLKGRVWCTQSMARVLYNDHMKYSLAACGGRIGEEKDDAVEEYIKKNKLWEWVKIPGKKKREKIKYYDKVPLSIIHPYGEQDVKVCWKVAKDQAAEMTKIHESSPENKPTIMDIAMLESKCTQVFFDMERSGVKIDRQYCIDGAKHEAGRVREAEQKLHEITGLDFIDSNKHLAQIFSNDGVKYPTTAKGNPSFPDEFLETLNSPVAGQVQQFRDATKRGGTYFQGFLYWADKQHYLHPDMRQSGTATGRLSYANPNLQNLTKADQGLYKVRRCVIPDEDSFLVSIDYDQMEFRLMLDYAGQMDLIQQIMDGYDPHTATAELVGIERRPAKILNFGLLYGMGLDLLAQTLKCTKDEAREFKKKYFSRLGMVQKFIKIATRRAERRGYVHDWLGRRFHFSDARFAYKAANAIIQGGCASIVKQAMVELDSFLRDKKSRMLVQIHDEVLFNLHNSEKYIVPSLQKIMADVYPYKNIPMSCSVTYSRENFYDMKDWNADDQKENRQA